jgi:hypothetical protein
MMSIDVEAVVNGLISKKPDKFPYERAIRFFQFQTWIYFSDDQRMVDAAGKLAAAAFLRKLERETAKRIPGIGRGMDVNSKILIQLLKTRQYSRLYNEFFQENGWTGLLTTFSPEHFNKSVAERRKAAETVSEMVDFRFRGLDHKTLDPKQSNISRSEFYRWYKHSNGPLSWKTIRSRWKDNRSSAPFLYANEKFGDIDLPVFDPVRPTKLLLEAVANQEKIRRFVGTSLYVAEVINADILEDYLGLKALAVPRLRPKTLALSESDLVKMNSYKEKRDEMRSK